MAGKWGEHLEQVIPIEGDATIKDGGASKKEQELIAKLAGLATREKAESVDGKSLEETGEIMEKLKEKAEGK
jgi:hypothetical protein